MGYPEELQRKCIGHMRSPAPADVGAGNAGEGEDELAGGGERRRGEDRDDREEREREREGEADGRVEGEGVPLGADEDAAGIKSEDVAGKEDQAGGAEGDGDGAAEIKDKDEVAKEETHRPEPITDKTREVSGFHKTNEEKWEEGLERKLAPLLGPVDIGDYYGKNIEECVSFRFVRSFGGDHRGHIRISATYVGW
jgi:hypothetical protein